MDFIEKYGSTKPEGRIDLILDYYHDFPAIIEGQQGLLIQKIKNEKDYLRQKNNKDLGVRIQNFKLSDPTAKEAIELVSIENAVISGVGIEELLNDLDPIETDVLYWNMYVLKKMREEYELLNNSVLLLNNLEKNTFKLFIENEGDIQNMAKAEGIQSTSVSKKVWRMRKKIKKKTVGSMLEML